MKFLLIKVLQHSNNFGLRHISNFTAFQERCQFRYVALASPNVSFIKSAPQQKLIKSGLFLLPDSSLLTTREAAAYNFGHVSLSVCLSDDKYRMP